MIGLLLFSLASAIITWFAVVTKNRRLEYLAKPATLSFLCLWFSTTLTSPFPALGVWFFFGLVFSLVGDIFLMFPDKHFLKGLIAFLLAHIAYVAAFNLNGFVLGSASTVIAITIAVVAIPILRRLLVGIRKKRKTAMAVPVVVYSFILSLTLWSAITTTLRPDWPQLAGWFAGLGGILFFFSDAAIAWNRYVGSHPGGRILEMFTYHIAQFTLSAAVLLSLGAIP